MKRFWGLFVAVLALIIFFCTYYSYRVIHAPLVKPGNPGVVIEVKKGMTTIALVQTLEAKKIIDAPRVVLRYIQIWGLAKQFKAGVYMINPNDSLKNFLQKVISAKVLMQSLTIVEGSTMQKLMQNLERAPFLNNPKDAFSAFALTGYPGIEGLVLADTYFYEAGSEASQLVQTAHSHLTRFLEHVWAERSPHLPYHSSYDLLIVASILEKESANSNERKLISSVIVNRLKKGMPLQMDPTVIYALKDNYQGKLQHADLSIDSHYNTYKYRGLPPTPIAIVGKDALLAAAHPVASDYLYFVAKGDGSHTFSTNYSAQRQAIEAYREHHGQ